MTQEEYNKLRNQGYSADQIKQRYSNSSTSSSQNTSSGQKMTQELYNSLRSRGYTADQIKAGKYKVPTPPKSGMPKSMAFWDEELSSYGDWAKGLSKDYDSWNPRQASAFSRDFSRYAQDAGDYLKELEKNGYRKGDEEYDAFADYYKTFSGISDSLNKNNEGYSKYRDAYMYQGADGSYLSYDQAKQREKELQDQIAGMKDEWVSDYSAFGGHRESNYNPDDKRAAEQELAGIQSWISGQNDTRAWQDWVAQNVNGSRDAESAYRDASSRAGQLESQKKEMEDSKPMPQDYIIEQTGALDYDAYTAAYAQWEDQYNRFIQDEYDPAQTDLTYAKRTASPEDSGRFLEYTTQDDFEELSQLDESQDKLFGGDQKYKYINNINGIQDGQHAASNSDEWFKYRFMTDEERSVYNYIHKKQGKKAANEFLDSLDIELSQRRYEQQSERMTDLATSSTAAKIGVSAATVAAQPFRTLSGVVAGVDDAIRLLDPDREINPYSRFRLGSQLTQDARSAVSQDMSGVGRFAYNTAMSALDSAVNAMTAGAFAGSLGLGADATMKATNTIASLLMSSEVASMAMSESKQKGYSDLGATAIGLIRGAIEYGSEYIGGEWVIKNVKANPLNALKTMVLNMIPEGTEEVMSDAANGAVNLVIDALFGTQESGIPALLDHFRNSDKEWQRKNPELATVLSILGDEALSFLGGAFATVGSSGVQTYNMSRSINQTAQQLNTTKEDVVKLMESLGTESPEGVAIMAELYDASTAKELRERMTDTAEAQQILQGIQRGDAEGIISAREFSAQKSNERALNDRINQMNDLEQQITDARKELGRLSPTDQAGRRAANERIKTAEDQLKTLRDQGLQDSYSSYTAEEKAASVKIDGKDMTVKGLTMESGSAQVKLADADGNTTTVEIDDKRLPDPVRSLALKTKSLGWAASAAFEYYKPGTNINEYVSRIQTIRSYAADKINRDAFMNSKAVQALDNAPLAEFLYSQGQKIAADRETKASALSRKLEQIQEAAASKTGNGTVRSKGKGKVDITTGANIEGQHFEGIKGKKLSKTQNAVVKMVNSLANTLNIDYVIFDGETGGVQGMYRDGVAYLNINAGRNVNGTFRSLAAETLAHELTHFIEQFAPAEYEELRSFVVETILKGDEQMFERRVRQKLGGLDPASAGDRYDGAVREVVADACTTMLQNSEAVTQLARQNLTLAQKIQDFITETVALIKEAFAESGDDTYRVERKAMENELERLQELWDEGIYAASTNYNALQTTDIDMDTVRRSVEDGKAISPVAEMQFSREYDDEFMSNAETINDESRLVDKKTMLSARQARKAIKDIMNDPAMADALKLPPDVMGKTLLSNTSYGGSEENTTVCVRSLAAQALMDEIATRLGRPLTVQDTLVISQEIMNYVDKPECIYCYVATDRRAYRDFLYRYLEERDAAIKDLESGTDYDTAYKKFLNGRKSTEAKKKGGKGGTKERFAMWSENAKNGTLIQRSDLASLEKLFAEIDELGKLTNRTAEQEARFAQLRDAAAYAQSASWAKKMIGYTAYNGHILKFSQSRVNNFNKHYGLRMYSFSDFSPAFILENMQMITDAAVKGLKVLAYTKEIDFVKIFAGTGANINVSVFASEVNGEIMQDEMMGANWAEAIELRKQYPNVGITLVATNDRILEWGLNNPNVDVVIPYHLVRTGQAVADFFKYTNYTSVSPDGKIQGINYKGKQTSVYPYQHQNDLILYVNKLKQLNLTPRFASYLKGLDQFYAGEISEQEFRDMNPHYMKLVNETRQATKESGLVQPVFNVDAAKESLNTLAKEGGYNRSFLTYLGKNEKSQTRALGRIEQSVRTAAEARGQFQRADQTETEEFKNWFKNSAVVNADGTPKIVFHQTAGDFTVFNTDNPVAGANDSETPNGIFFKENDHDIGLDGKKQMAVYLSIQNPLRFKNRQQANLWYQRNIAGYKDLQNEMNSKINPLNTEMEKIEDDMFAEGVTDERYEELDAEWNAKLQEMSKIENNYRGRLRDLLNDYFLNNDSGYDGIELEYDGHRYVNSKREDVHTWIIFKNTQVKSATDNIGTFDRSNPDIQFQRADNLIEDTEFEIRTRDDRINELMAENKVLEEAVTKLKQQAKKLGKEMKLSRGPQETRLSDARKLAGEILKETGSSQDAKAIADRIKAVGDAIYEDADYVSLRGLAVDIARDIVSDVNVALDDGTGAEDLRNDFKAALKNRTIYVPEQYRADTGDWVAFKKKYFGVMKFSNNGVPIDQLYTALLEEMPGVLDPNINNPGDMINELAEKWDAMQPVMGNPFGDYMNEAIEHYANQILQAALDGTLRTAETYADRMNARLDKERAEKWAKVAEIRAQMNDRLNQLRSEKNERIEEVRQQGLARKQEAVAKERAEKWAKVEKTKKYYQDMAKRATVRRRNTATRGQIRDLIGELNSRLLRPTEKRYVPAPLVKDTIEILEMIDLSTERSGEKLQAKLAMLQQKYSAMKNDSTFSGYAYDPIMDEMIQNMAKTVGDTPLNKMSMDQLSTVLDTLKALNHMIKTAVTVKINGEERDAYEIARGMTRETKNAKGTALNAFSQLYNKYVIGTMRPDIVFEYFAGFTKGSQWSQVAEMLNEAQRKGQDLQMQFAQVFDEVLNDKQQVRKLTSNKDADMVDVGLKDEDGNTVKITRDFMLALYLNLFNEDNVRHIMRGGMQIPNFKEYLAGKGDRGYGVGSVRVHGISERLAEIDHEIADTTDEERLEVLKQLRDDVIQEGEAFVSDLRVEIQQKMTEYDHKWVAAWWNFESMAQKALNDTTMEVYGIKKATVERYFPIITDKNFINAPMENLVHDMTLENIGSMKERVQASGPIKLMGLSDIVNMQANRTAQYAAIMPATRAFGKIYNKTMPGYSTSVQDALNSKFGGDGKKFVENLMQDLQGGRKADYMIFDRLRGRMAQATLSLNPRVALAQTASFPTAAAELGWKPVLKALARGGKKNWMFSAADRDLIAKYSSALWFRSRGYTSVEMGDVKNMNQLQHKVMDKVGWAMNWINFMDTATVGRLWYAAQYYVDEQNPDLEKGSDAYYEAVAEAFNRTVERTQPNYTTLQRPELLRSPNAIVRQLAMFMTQRLQNQSISYGAAARYLKYRSDLATGKNGITEADVKQAGIEAARAATSQVAATATIVVFQFLCDALLHRLKKYRDEDEKLTAESVSLACLDNFANSLVSNMFLGSELYSAIKSIVTKETYYGIELSGVTTLTDAVTNVVKFAQKPSWPMAKKLGEALAQYLGIPAANAEKIGMALWYHMQDAMNGEFLSFESDVERSNAQNAKLLTQAYLTGNKENIEKFSVAFKDEDTMLGSVRDYVKSGYVVQKGTAQTISKEQAVQILMDAGMRKKDAEDKVQEWTCEIVTGIPFSKIKDEYMAGNITESRVSQLLQTYGGRKKEDADRTARGYACEKDTGHPYADLKEAYLNGEISKTELEAALRKYGQLKQGEATKRRVYYDFLIENPEADISEERAYAYMTKVKPTGISAKEFTSMLYDVDADTNGSFSQDEVGKYLNAKHYTTSQNDALWETFGNNWKISFDTWQVKTAADAAGTGKGAGNGNVSQDELGYYLVEQIRAGRMTQSQADKYWSSLLTTSKKDFSAWCRAKRIGLG